MRTPLELMHAAQGGDGDAFGELYVLYRQQLLRQAGHMVGYEHAEDVVQDVFFRALRSLPRWSDVGRPPGAWLSVICRNVAYDRAKSGAWRFERPCGEHPDWEQPLFSQQPDDPAEVTQREYAARRARDAVEYLTVEQQEVVRLFYGNGLSGEEVARLTGRKVGAVKALLYRAKRAAEASLVDLR